MSDLYPYDSSLVIPKEMIGKFGNLIMEHDAHVYLYDVRVFMDYRIAAKQRKDLAMTHCLKMMVNIYMRPFRSIRQVLQNQYPDYLKEV